MKEFPGNKIIFHDGNYRTSNLFGESLKPEPILKRFNYILVSIIVLISYLSIGFYLTNNFYEHLIVLISAILFQIFL